MKNFLNTAAMLLFVAGVSLVTSCKKDPTVTPPVAGESTSLNFTAIMVYMSRKKY